MDSYKEYYTKEKKIYKNLLLSSFNQLKLKKALPVKTFNAQFFMKF